jgi:hypothetical protein
MLIPHSFDCSFLLVGNCVSESRISGEIVKKYLSKVSVSFMASGITVKKEWCPSKADPRRKRLLALFFSMSIRSKILI